MKPHFCRLCISWKRRDDEVGQCWHDAADAPETHEHHTCPSWAQKVIMGQHPVETRPDVVPS